MDIPSQPMRTVQTATIGGLVPPPLHITTLLQGSSSRKNHPPSPDNNNSDASHTSASNTSGSSDSSDKPSSTRARDRRPRLSLLTDLNLNTPPNYYKVASHDLQPPLKLPVSSEAPLLPPSPEKSPFLSNQKSVDPSIKLCRICLEGEEDKDALDGPHDEEHGQFNKQINPTLARQPSYREAVKAVKPKEKKRACKNQLIHPCHCHGTMKYIHLECLSRWHKESPKSEPYYRCDTCHYTYKLSRLYWASIISNNTLLWVVTVFLAMCVILSIAYIIKVVDVFGLKHTPQLYDPVWINFHGPTILWMDSFYFLLSIIITSVLGFVYLSVASCMSRSKSNCLFDFLGLGSPGNTRNFGCVVVLFVLLGTFLGIFLVVRSWLDWVVCGIVEQILEV